MQTINIRHLNKHLKPTRQKITIKKPHKQQTTKK